MKPFTVTFFTKIWLLHLLVYYTFYGLLARTLVAFKNGDIYYNVFKDLYVLPFAALIMGIMGFVDNFPAFIVIPIIFMQVLIHNKFKHNWFLAYCISVITSYLLDYIWIYYDNKSRIFGFHLIFPSIAIAILVNWLLFKKKYRQLANQTEIDNPTI